MEKPKLLIVAGPNGSGKTSVTGKILKHEWVEGCEYINPDFIARDVFGDWNSKETVMQAAKYAADWREKCLEGGHDVPIQKIISRYYKSIINCAMLAQCVDRLYIYDNSIDNVFAELLFRASEGQLTKQYTQIHDWANVIFENINEKNMI
ncbi:ATPase AAA [Bacteroidia bacterium]|nr:ATPase AAA [Bacteroidia bacterium]